MKHTGGMQYPVIGQRRAFLNRVRKRALKAKLQIGDVRPYRIKLYAPIVNGKSHLKFLVNQENSLVNPLEIKLEKSDVMYIDRVALGIHGVNINAEGTEFPANTPVLFYPDRNFFDGAAAQEAADLEVLYNSILNVRTDTNVRLEKISTERFRCVPDTQYEAADAANNIPATWPSYDGEEYLTEIITNIALWGNKRNEIEIQYGDGKFSDAAGVADTRKNYAVLYLDGFVLVNGAEAVTVSDFGQLIG